MVQSCLSTKMWGAFFPGQGSQSVGMGKFLYDQFPRAKRTFEEAGDILKMDFRKLCFEGPESELSMTENAQPALLLVSTLCYEILYEHTGIKVHAGSGHSAGEYSALVSAGVLKFSDALQAVRRRGIAMQKAVPVGEGAMLAILGLHDTQVKDLCKWAEDSSDWKPLETANFNSPGQVVVSGSAIACAWLSQNLSSPNLKEAFPDFPKVKAIPLKVSAPFHCSLMKPAEEEMRRVLSEITFSEAKWKVVQNFAGKVLADPNKVREHLIKQITGPVLWTTCVQRLMRLGCDNFIEFGSGRVLSGLAKKIDSSGINTFNMNNLEEWMLLEQKILGSEKASLQI